MIVTQVTEISKTKIKVCLDNEEMFSLYKSEQRTYHITEGMELSKEVYHTLVKEVLPKRAKLRSMNLLKNKDYTEYQLREKLKQGCYPETSIDQAIEYVKSFGYINDVRYACSYIDYASTTKSRRQIEMTLIRRGVSKEDINQAYTQCSDEGDLTGEEELIEKLLDKKHFNRQEATYEERMKMIGTLYRKGFSLDKIYQVVDRE